MPKNPIAPPASAEVTALRADLLRRGLPLVLVRRDRLDALAPRSAPALVGLFVFLLGLSLATTRMASMTLAESEAPPPDDLRVIGIGLLCMILAPGAWWAAWWALRRLPQPVGTAGTLIAAALTLLLHSFPLTSEGGGYGELGAAVLVVLLATYWGLGSMTGWAARRAGRELSRLGAMVGRVLPILMLTLLFSFYNAEIWQVVAQLSMARTWAAVAVIAALGIGLSVLTARDEVRRVVAEHDAGTEHPDLRPMERANITLVCVLISLIQVSILAVVVFIFYVAFGLLTVSNATAGQWIGSPPEQLGGVLSPFSLSKPLVQVCLILGAFSALNFSVSTAADPMYRTTFLEPALEEVRDGLTIRNRYAQAREHRSPRPERSV